MVYSVTSIMTIIVVRFRVNVVLKLYIKFLKRNVEVGLGLVFYLRLIYRHDALWKKFITAAFVGFVVVLGKTGELGARFVLSTSAAVCRVVIAFASFALICLSRRVGGGLDWWW